ncbi:DUF3794 domain-containing protein [Christensenellaceae bacterium OttesenSCG-928-M15]|nr:DUF3794 domain-containing protein [Christensenellaceae bacterium OttesenSCG-928-M15]
MEPIRSDLSLKRVAGRTAKQAVMESDIPMPAGQSVERILSVQGEINNQIGRCLHAQIEAEGTLTLDLLCLNKENIPFGMRASTQYNHTLPMENVEEGMEATVKPQMLDLRCALRDGRLKMDAVVELNAVAMQEEAMPVLTDVAGAPGLQTQYVDADVGDLKFIGAQGLRMHETLPAPGVQQVLLSCAKVQVNGVEVLDGDVNVMGTLFTSILYVDENAQYTHLNQQIPMQGTINVDLDARDCENVIANARVEEVNVALNPEPGMLDMDVAVRLEAQCIKNMRVHTLCDAYMSNGCLKCTQQRVEQLNSIAGASRACNYTEVVRLPETLPDAFRAIYATARPTTLGLVNDNGNLAVEGIFITTVCYQTDDGQIVGFEEDVPFSCTLDAPYAPDADVDVQMLEVRTSGSGRLLNVAYMVETKAVLRELVHVNVAVDVEETEPAQRENGILVSYAAAGEGFWDVGKRYGATQEQLRGWNPELNEPFCEGQAVLILSTRGRKK